MPLRRLPLVATTLALFFLSATPVPAQDRLPVRSAVTHITAANIAGVVDVLAHDSMAGRDTPSPELETAAAYLAARFESLGLEPAGENGTFIDRYEFEPEWTEAGWAEVQRMISQP